MLFIIKVTTNKEERAIEMIAERARKKGLNIYALARPHGIRGYIVLEAADRESAEEGVFNLPYVKGIIGKTVQYSEIQQMLEPKIEEMNIALNDIVEIIGQTFKGEQAKVTRIDKGKGEVVVSLLGASVPIPVTVKMDNVKVIRREEEGEKESEEEEE
ncbi:transcription elongation factor Spt5 [Candidatus Pacearchaeota archaeon]|nr:transcription elongation factor Spt5 [Candidatus Pacearchaeota archaeon]